MKDKRRAALERAFRDFAEYKIHLSDFATLVEPRAGLVVNSVQTSNTNANHAFNRVVTLFLQQMNISKGKCPEELEIVLFFGSYDQGFGLHQDTTDVMMFVLDGKKGFIVERDGRREKFELTAGRYLRWEASNPHANHNPCGHWGFTMNITLGPAANGRVAPGTAVEYIYPDVKFKDMREYLLLASTQKCSRS